MLIDLIFFAFPCLLAVCMAFTAVKEEDQRYWKACACLSAYCLFYLVEGRDIIIYMITSQMPGWGLLEPMGGGGG